MNPHPYFFVLCFLFNLNVLAGDTAVISEQRVYKTIDGIQLKADIFYTAETRQKPMNPAIAFFHGGGWAYGSPDEFHGACRRFARKGFITVSFQYRLSVNEDGSVPHPVITPVESTRDARSALRWLRENAASFNIDPDKIVAGGQSAGGQLALSTAMLDTINEASDNLDISPVPAALLLYSSNVNTMEAWVDRLLGERRQEIWSISPYHNVKAGMPPAIEFHGEEDCTVPIWIVYLFRDKTVALGNYFDLVALEGRKHYLGEGIDEYATYFDEEILEKTDDFLRKFGFMDPSF
jgi:acetyl esterase